MSQEQPNVYDNVGPVLQVGVLSEAIIAAIRDLNSDVEVIDRGGYLRVLVPHRCIVTCSAIEKHLGRSVRFPGELETVMSAFKGTLKLTEDEAVWQFKRMPDGNKH
jgi:toluene monooxygenase system protein D